MTHKTIITQRKSRKRWKKTNRFDLLKQTNTDLAARVIIELGEKFHNNPEALVEHLEGKITEEELHQINDAAHKEGLRPIVFIS